MKDTLRLTPGVMQLETHYPSGALSRKMTYRDGEIDGTFQEYHPNGQLMESAQRVGEVEGTNMEYHPNGRVIEVTPYVDGYARRARDHWDNGLVRERITYVNGERQGPWTVHDRTGKVVARYRMRNDDVVEMGKWSRRAPKRNGVGRTRSGGGPVPASGEVLVNMRRAYQDQSAVYLVRNTTYRIERTSTGVVAHRDMEEDELLLKDRTGTAHKQEIHYSDLIPLERLEAYTLVPNGRGTKRVPVDKVDRRDEREDYIFHDDSKVASFVMPSLISGAVAHVEHTIAYPDARLVSGHFFAGVYPTESSTLTVISDQDIDVDVRTSTYPTVWSHARSPSKKDDACSGSPCIRCRR